MEHSQQVFEVNQEQRASQRFLVSYHSEQVSEFFVDVEMKKQVKQNDKHEVHLLVLQTHFVVPVLESLDLEMVERLEMVEAAKMHSVSRRVAGRKVEVAEHMAADTIEPAVHMRVAEVAGSARSQSVAQRKQNLDMLEARFARILEVPRTCLLRVVPDMAVDSLEKRETRPVVMAVL